MIEKIRWTLFFFSFFQIYLIFYIFFFNCCNLIFADHANYVIGSITFFKTSLYLHDLANKTKQKVPLEVKSIPIHSTFLAYKYRVIMDRILLSTHNPFIKWAIMALGSIVFNFRSSSSSSCSHKPPDILKSSHQMGACLRTIIYRPLSADMHKKLFMKM